MVVDAVERNLERLSEATRHIPAKLTAAESDIPWRQVADLGNVLRHRYHSVLDDQIWVIVERDLHPLRASVERMMKSLEADHPDEG